MKITKRKYITTITYDKICNGVKNSCRESFFDKKYVDIRVDEINNCEYDKEYKINQDTLFLDFIDIYLKKVSMKIDPYKKYEFYVSLTRRYIMDYFEDVYIKDITSTFIENLSIQVNNQVSKYGNKEKVISKTLKNDIKFFFNKLFKYATDMNLYDINPMQYYKVENSSNRYLIEWDIDTLNTIFELSKGTRLHMFLHCFFGTDLKMNEILALKWDDLYIDKKNIIKNNCYAFVNKKLKRKKISYINENKEKIIKQFDPKINDESCTKLVIYKTKNSKKIYILINVAKMLIKWKEIEDRKYQTYYEESENNNLVFSLANGKACEDRIINKEFDKLKYENNLPDVKMSRLELFSKERIIYKEEVMTIRDFYYRTLFYDYSEYFEIGYIKNGSSYNNNIIPIGTNYRSVNLKDIKVPKKNEIDLSKMISLIKNNSSLSNELTSILKE